MYIYNIKENRPFIKELDENAVSENDLIIVEGEEYISLMDTIKKGGYEIGIENNKVVPVPIKKYAQEIYDQLEQNSKNLEFLKSTDWIMNKYIDVVIVSKNMTDEDFNKKYFDIIHKRQIARDSIIELELD
jgi:organic radical activating enzyme